MSLYRLPSHSSSCPHAIWQPAVRVKAMRSRKRLITKAAYNSDSGSAGSSSSLLDAFFFGKAFAETLNERLGTALDDLLADFGKKDAERREAMREFQEEVEQRARREIEQSRDSAGSISTGSRTTSSSSAYPSPTTMTMQGGRASSNGASPSGSRQQGTRQAMIATPPDLQETVDELRAEMASTRASVKILKAKQQPSIL